jgi:competence protein ComEC
VAVGSFALGLGLAPAPASHALLAAAVLLALACLAARHPAAISAGLGCALVLAGAVTGDARLTAIDRHSERVLDGERVVLRAHLLGRPRASQFGSRAELRVAAGRLRGARLLARFPVWGRPPPSGPLGAELEIAGRLRSLDALPPPADGFDQAAFLRTRGIAGELLVDRARPTGRRRSGFAGTVDRMREHAGRAVAAGLPGGESALLRGMVLGEDEAIAEPVREDFRSSGLAHILAVSGQNVMLLYALALPALVALGLGRGMRAALLLALIALYVPLAGAGPSLQRAAVMGAAGIVAMHASRPASRVHALLLAAAATLALNPRTSSDPGWQLSFAAVAGILWLGPPLRALFLKTVAELWPAIRRPRISNRSGRAGALSGAAAAARSRSVGRAAAGALAEGAALTIAATLATAPLLAYHFDSVSLAALPANLLALPAIAPAMWIGMVKAALGQAAAAAPLAPLAEPAAAALGQVARLPVAWIAWVAERLGALPGAEAELPLSSPASVALAYLALVAAVAGLRRAARPLGPQAIAAAARIRRLAPAHRASVAATLAAALALAAAHALGPPPPPAALTVRFLDVGQGDATLIQHPDGSAVLFDGGPPEAGVARLLRRAGVRRLSAVVATHASRDHHGGLPEVLERYPVDVLLDGGDGSRDPGFRAVLQAAAANGVRRVAAQAPLSLTAGSIAIEILSPEPRPPGPPPEDPNPRAVVAVVSSGGLDVLLSGDAESETLNTLDLPDVDAMKVPHHGSADPGLPEALEELDPEIAAIEVGPNTYGHPAPSTLAALDRADVRTYRTDRHGTVTLTARAGALAVDTER